MAESQMSRKWGRMAFKVKGIDGLYRGPEVRTQVTTQETQALNVAEELIKPQIPQHPKCHAKESGLTLREIREPLTPFPQKRLMIRSGL